MAPPEKRMASKHNTGILSLIAAANEGDRFRLLEDDSISPPDLDNGIHSIFRGFDSAGPLQRTLRLASQFLQHDSVLIFFVPLLFGSEITTVIDGKPKTYLSDPLSDASITKGQRLLRETRSAIMCISHSLEIAFAALDKRTYGRTIISDKKPKHNSRCFYGFHGNISARIEISSRFQQFYDDPNGYAEASLCGQLRHDFMLATTLVHEFAHAVGILRRENMNEPHIRADYPETEWGFAWEHFMFGSILNPQDGRKLGTNLLMRKVWVDSNAAVDAGGKEYCDVPMAYIAQWFLKGTWDVVARWGPTAIPLPVTHFKIQSSEKFGAWIVSTDCAAIRPDLTRTFELWKELSRGAGEPSKRFCRILWRFQTTEELQRPNARPPTRLSVNWGRCLTCGPFLGVNNSQSILVDVLQKDPLSRKRKIAALDANEGIRKRAKQCKAMRDPVC